MVYSNRGEHDPGKQGTMIRRHDLSHGADAPSDDHLKDVVQVFKLLSDATRLRILIHLMRRHELHVRALCDLLGQSQPAVSHHLALLRVAGLIEARREGKHNFYHVLPERFQQVLDVVFRTVPGDDQQIHLDDYVLSYARTHEA
jgi:ArsR family transcriptional regulator